MLRRTAVRLLDVQAMAEKVVAGDRRMLSKAITLVESGNREHRKTAEELLQIVAEKRIAQRGDGLGSYKIAVSGPPGAGKSCFIEAFGTHLTDMGKKVAVLTIDPSSTISGGSLLGDKTRMDQLSINKNAYVRPSPTKGCLGGVAAATYDTLQLCEGAGYDVCVIETVGVGQSEVAARGMSDCFILLLPPANGDELQGIKKGIVEVADMVCITKADGSTERLAQKTQAEYRKALQLIRPYGLATDWKPPVITCSAQQNKGIKEAWEVALKFFTSEHDALVQRRKDMRVAKLWEFIRKEITDRLEADPRLAQRTADTRHCVESGVLSPRLASRRILDAWVATNAPSSIS